MLFLDYWNRFYKKRRKGNRNSRQIYWVKGVLTTARVFPSNKQRVGMGNQHDRLQGALERVWEGWRVLGKRKAP